MAARTVVYGLANCDSCRKARRWLDAKKIAYRFHDVRKDGLDMKTLRRLAKHADWHELVNRRSTTWRSLDAAARDSLGAGTSLTLIEQHPTLLKRPVLETAKAIAVGFDAERWSEMLP